MFSIIYIHTIYVLYILGEKVAILLMDTQGMFDNETTMNLTAQIFGLSTLGSKQYISLLF